jgi:hypothetical protein
MDTPAPIGQFNKWSCTLACISWVLAKNSTPTSQEDIIHKLGLWYPEWFHREGLMDRGDILTLFARLGVPIRKFVHLNDKGEILRLITKYYSDYFAGFVLTRKPTNHCLAIDSWSGDIVRVMEPNPTTPAFHDLRWDDLFRQSDADVLWLFR